MSLESGSIPVTDAALKSCAKLRALTLFEIGPDTPPITAQKSKPRRPR